MRRLEDDAALRHLARRLLAHESGNSQDPGDIARAADAVCQKLYGQMRLLVGPVGFLAVLNRALRVTGRESPFLGEVRVTGGDGVDLSGFREALEGREMLLAMEITGTFVYNCINLLVVLLGRKLSYRYLQTAWPELDIE